VGGGIQGGLGEVSVLAHEIEHMREANREGGVAGEDKTQRTLDPILNADPPRDNALDVRVRVAVRPRHGAAGGADVAYQPSITEQPAYVPQPLKINMPVYRSNCQMEFLCKLWGSTTHKIYGSVVSQCRDDVADEGNSCK
jgi:hypothetical protein